MLSLFVLGKARMGFMETVAMKKESRKGLESTDMNCLIPVSDWLRKNVTSGPSY